MFFIFQRILEFPADKSRGDKEDLKNINENIGHEIEINVSNNDRKDSFH